MRARWRLYGVSNDPDAVLAPPLLPRLTPWLSNRLCLCQVAERRPKAALRLRFRLCSEQSCLSPQKALAVTANSAHARQVI